MRNIMNKNNIRDYDYKTEDYCDGFADGYSEGYEDGWDDCTDYFENDDCDW